MFTRHFKSWPKNLPRHLSVPNTAVHYNLEVTARRFPRRNALIYYGGTLTYAELRDQVERLAGYLQQDCGVAKGDRVLLYMQNSPQFVIGFYAILRADAVVVPVNPMNRAAELAHMVANTGARAVIVGQELFPIVQPLIGPSLKCVVACYAEYADPQFDLQVPDVVATPPDRAIGAMQDVTTWQAALNAGREPAASCTGPEDLAVIPYSSGTTGHQKGCMHTHATVMTTLVGGVVWTPITADSVHLASLPLFHVTGMQASMNQPIYLGATVVLMTRWDRRLAAQLIERYRIQRWRCITTMAIDFVNDPEVRKHDISSLEGIGGGGAAMPQAVARRLFDLTGLTYIEGYGLSETIAATHINPLDNPKAMCLGIPVFDVDSRVVSVETGKELPLGEVGEIVINGPQVFKGYWNDPKSTRDAFFELDGKQFFRTGDLGYYDEDGYFFIVDRLKRMISVSGYKVWPTELEAMMLRHPAISEVCVISVPDSRRGEAVKACVVLRETHRATSGDDIIQWCRAEIAAYKCPTLVEIVPDLPRSGSGKVQWRELQERERARAG